MAKSIYYPFPKGFLREWNVIRSIVVEEWQMIARLETLVKMMLGTLEAKFGNVPVDVADRIRAIGDPDLFYKLQIEVIRAATLEDWVAHLPPIN